MKKLLAKKILPLFILAVFLIQAVIPTTIFAGTRALDYDNPNKSGNNPYQVSLKGIINSNLLTSLVGCTGIVDKVSKVTVEFAQKLLKKNEKKTETKTKVHSEENSSVPSVDGTQIEEDQEHSQKEEERDDKTSFTEDCLKGIATTLAKNQLTAMTKYTMNWISTGFNGDPLYVRNVNSYVDSITTDLLKAENEFFKDPANSGAYPYGRDYAIGQVNSYKSSKNAYEALKQDLTAYLPDGVTPNMFSNNLTSWDAWLAFTTRPENNPLGFTLKATNQLAKKQNAAKEEAKAEIARGSGVLDQKKCIEYKKPKQGEAHGWEEGGLAQDEGTAECIKYETITPGSVIKAKIDTYINSPERQIELAKTLNDALNALFSALINKFENQGLAGLKPKNGDALDSMSGGFGTNSVVDSLGNTLSSTNVFDDDNSIGSRRVNQSFDITRDLGNKYSQAVKTGSWDADTNTPELMPGVGTKNQYYVVSVAGDTKLFAGTHHWNVGEKVYFNGTAWQSGVPKYIIESKGIFQLQKDYMASITKTVKVLPQVIPKLSELDYCIPGPNTNWKSNSDEARNEYLAYLSGISTEYVSDVWSAQSAGCFAGCFFFNGLASIFGGGRDHSYDKLVIPDFSNYKKIFSDARNLWPKIEAQEAFWVIRPVWTTYPAGASHWEVKPAQVEAQVKKWNDLAIKSFNEYLTKVNERYGLNSPMRTEFTPEGDPNPAFLPMAQAGLDLTKNITTDAEDLPDAIKTAESNFAQTSGAIYRLGFIKDKVNVIIAAAQKRRKDKRSALNLPDMPQICLDNEKITWVSNDVLKY